MTERDDKFAGRAFIWAMTGLLYVNVMNVQAADLAQFRDQKQLEQKLALVERILFRSPLGERAEKTPTDLDPAAYEAWLAAGLAFELAVEALERKNHNNADESLNLALAHFREASSLNRKDGQQKHDYSALLKDLKSRIDGYQDSLERIAREKNVALTERLSREKIKQALTTAEHYEHDGDTERAIKVLQSLQSALESELVLARSGETLVSSVEFSSTQDAFDYEIRKSRSNEQLLELIFSNNKLSEDKRQLVDTYLKESRDASVQAKHLHDKGDLDSALRALESATAAQTRALRLLGVNM